jgi:hypothetical protein
MEVNFVAKSLGKSLGKKAPFIGQENCLLQSFRGASELSLELLWTVLRTEYSTTAQSGAEPGAILDCILDFQKQQKHSYEKCNIFCIQTPFLVNLGFLKS